LLVIDNQQYTENGINNTECIRNGMNRQRTYFSWHHLNNLYFL
jgi:hypothetical protein